MGEYKSLLHLYPSLGTTIAYNADAVSRIGVDSGGNLLQ